MMKNLLLLLVLIAAVACSLVTAQTSLKIVNKAIYDFLADKSSSIGFTSIHQSYFGDNILHAPTTSCTNYTTWPTLSEAQADSTMSSILSRKYIIFGTNAVTNVPKRFNYTAVGANFGKCTGFEAEIGASIAYRIGMQYSGSPFQAYFVNNTIWTNIITDLTNQKFDFILSGMSIEGTWSVAGVNVPRTDLVDFTCPYVKDGTGVVKGNLAASVSFSSLSDVNQKEINLCVQSGTSMETLAKANFPNANITSFTLGADPYTKTLNADFCHAYMAPIINALYQVKLDATKLAYVGDVGATTNIAVAARKSAIIPAKTSTKSSATSATLHSLVVLVLISFISFMISLL